MMNRLTQLRRFSLIALALLLLTSVVLVSAQAATPIAIGENKAGALDATVSVVPYSISVATPQSVNIQVLAISQGLTPTFRVLDPSGLVVLDVPPSGVGTIAQSSLNLTSTDPYTIEVRGANNTTGQFLISLQPGAPLLPPEPLTLGQALNGSVDPQNTRRAYTFSGSEEEPLLLLVRSELPTVGEVVALRDAETNEMLGLITASLGGMQFRIMPAPRDYLLEVMHSGSPNAEAFVVCLSTESGSVTCPGLGAQAAPTVVVPTPLLSLTLIPTLIPTSIAPPTFAPPTINPAGACQVVTRGQFVNVRSGPGTGFAVLTQLAPTAAAPVIGRLPDNTWFQVNVNGIIGWLSASVVTLGGNCSGVSVVIPPSPIPPSASVIPPMETQELTPGTPTATATASSTPTVTPTPTATFSGTLVFPVLTLRVPLTTLVFEELEPAELDYTAAPNYGQANLSAGFIPDPYSIGMTSGGNVNVSYLGSSCTGFATVSPDLRVNFSGSGASLLRFYFIGSGDTTIVVNDPFGNFYCVDDSFATLNPTIDFNNPAGGSYDIWVGSYAAGAFVSGTLYVTELTGNHP
jgi:hypothetical protein